MKTWTNQSIYEEAKKYSSKSDWFKFSNTTYQLAKRRGIFAECTSHMVPKNRSSKWTKESILKEASKFSSISDWLEGSPKSYDAALKKGLIEEISTSLNLARKRRTNITEQDVFSSIKGYEFLSDWRKNFPSLYSFASKNNLLSQIKEMLQTKITRWSLSDVKKESQKYSSISEWKKNSPKSYDAASRNGWISQCSGHMARPSYSRPELEIFNTIKAIYPKSHKAIFKNKNADFVATKFELDIYIPEVRKGIEFNGDYWHSLEGLKRGRPNWKEEDLKRYHELKKSFFEQRNIKVLEVWEKEWKAQPKEQLQKIIEWVRNDV
jgi:hypothetical protein